MNFDIKDLGATLVTGAYFLLGLIFLFYSFSGGNFLFFLAFVKRMTGVAVTVLVLSLAFGVGMLLEDVSNKIVDSDPAQALGLLPLDKTLRAETLFGEDFLAGGSEPGPLSCSAVRLGLLARHGDEGRKATNAVNAKNSKIGGNFDRAATSLYYEAKNTVYRQASYYDELKQIQTRIDFSRSFAVTSLLLAAMGLVFAVVARFAPKWFELLAVRWDLQGVRNLSSVDLFFRVLSLGVLVAMFFLARFAYSSEEHEFNKRAYGYFFSLVKNDAKDHAEPEVPRCGSIGYSGLWPIDKSTFLVVHDVKADCAEPRLGTLTVQSGVTPVYEPIELDWGAEPPNDLEAVCAVPGTDNEFLLAESGYYNGKFGRLFHVRLVRQLERRIVEVKGRIELPKDTENIEGLACLASNSKALIILLGERGGSEKDPTGRIRWAPLDLVSYTPIKIIDEREFVLPAASPAGKNVRGCADLFIDTAHRIWTVATQDRGDDGPFRSVVYQAGTVDPNAAVPVQMLPSTTAAWTLDGVKVEGISTSPFEDSPISVATDDERYDGIWRPLFQAQGPNGNDVARP
jgi:hypothetical protein